MSNVLGMDVQAIRNLANQLNAKADEIDSIMNLLTQMLDVAVWTGPDAQNFRNDWHTTHRSQLHAVSTALRDASQRSSQNASQQEQASAS
jgi:uncharacterized protein YukE